ncbi:MAG: hypothetical protein JWO07_796 [Candidatus Saccharibacteria bacterium]|nr:hypothetical protein [Candidatus Saccharibacteria bacterium]
MDDLYDSMQTPANRDAVDRAFRMTPAQMAELLREVYGPEPVLELHDAEHEDLKDADSSE